MNVLGGLESAILCLARLLRVKMDFVYPQLANLMLNVHLLGMSAHLEDFQVIHFIIPRIHHITKTKQNQSILFFSGSCNVTGDSCEYNPVLSIAICGK